MEALNSFYTSLAKIRDEFHKYGNFNDSNSKLDEITKLISIYLFDLQKTHTPTLIDLINNYQIDTKIPLVKELKKKFKILNNSKEFKSSDDRSIFHDDSELKLYEKDNEFAFKLITLITKTLEKLNGNENRFDFINETFGHFVRDNFRNNLEDAQYMTPIEVVELMNNIAIDRIKNGQLKVSKDFFVCDPSCGVGSFLTEFHHRNKIESLIDGKNLRLIGQDKVPRMVRLTSLNLMLFNSTRNAVFSGNSLIGKSNLDDYNGKVDLILTNPPFGARFSNKDLTKENKTKFPLLYDIVKTNSSINSEILFIDRCVSLLKEGGELLAIVPDSVISSHGMPDTLRHRIINNENLSIKSIIELPVETFAQAGTRTKTSILHLKKESSSENSKVFIAKSDGIGFDVSTRKGATIKINKGENDLPKISEKYLQHFSTDIINEFNILNELPSVCIIKESFLKENSWTPNHYSSQRLNIIDKNNSNKNNKDFEFVKLNELVRIDTKFRRKEPIGENSKCLSVLHVFNGDVIDYEEMMDYSPKYPGIVCYSGDLLFSKINPRIQRVLVVPPFDFSLTCSTEFEIMNSISGISNYGIKLLLMLPSVKTQILSLTSGTSSSHNRIKTKELESILIPYPKENTRLHETFSKKLEVYEKKIKSFNKLGVERLKIKESISIAYNL